MTNIRQGHDQEQIAEDLRQGVHLGKVNPKGGSGIPPPRGPFPFSFDSPGISVGQILPIIALNVDEQTVTVEGNKTSLFEDGCSFKIAESVNEGNYQLIQAVLVDGNTVLSLVTDIHTIVDDTVEGNVISPPGFAFGFTPTIGDILLDLWFEFDQQWDGTTPKLDTGTWKHTLNDNRYDRGLLGVVAGVISLSSANTPISPRFGPVAGSSGSFGIAGASANGLGRAAPASFLYDVPLRVWSTTDGKLTGDDPEGSVGTGNAYIITATPVI